MNEKIKEKMEKILFKDRTCWVCGAKLNDGENTVCKGAHRWKEYVFTFGCGQKYENCFHVIRAESWAKARERMREKFGNKWSMQYESREQAGVYQFNLTEVK